MPSENIIPIIIPTVSLIIVFFWWLFFRERIGYVWPNALMQKYKRTPWKIWILWFLRWIIVSVVIFLIFSPTRTIEKNLLEREKHNILILLDISRSMLAEDILPSRIEAAKSTIRSFANDRAADNFWLIVFAGKPFFSMPFSQDTRGIASIIENITPSYIRQELPWLSWTAIGDALLLGNQTLSGMTGKSSIVLITDGRANIGIDPLLAADETASLGYPVYTIAIWGSGSEALTYTDPYSGKRITLEDENGKPLKGDIDESLLRTISERTHGAYFHAQDARSLYEYWNTIDTSLGNSQKQVTRNVVVSYRFPLFFFLILFVFSERTLQKYIFYKNVTK